MTTTPEERFAAKLKKVREQHTAERDQLRATIRTLRKQIFGARSEGFKEGSRATLSALYSVAPNDAVRIWLSDMLMSAKNPREPQNHLTAEQNDHIVALIEAMLDRRGLSKAFLETDDLSDVVAEDVP